MFTTMRKRGDKLENIFETSYYRKTIFSKLLIIASAKCKMLQIIFPVIFQSDSDILIVMVKSTKI